MDLKNFLEKGGEEHLPNLSIDLVIIGYEGNELKCLLLRVGEKWMLPGGYVQRRESVDEAVQRVLMKRTQLKDPFMKFLAVFGHQDRQFSEEFNQAFPKHGLEWNKDYWINDRFVTLAHYSLVDIQQTHPAVSGFDEEFAWHSFEQLPDMWLDHEAIVLTARDKLKEDVRKEHVSYNLLPSEFTMPELHHLHETILQEKLDRSRFQKKMLSSGLFERLPKRQKETPGRNPYQYRVKVSE